MAEQHRTRQQAEGRWYDILTKLGISSDYLVNHHGPCPLCGGSDRFRWDDQGQGSWICNQCGAGDGFTLLMKYHNQDFKTVAKDVDQILGICHPRLVHTRSSEEARTVLRRIEKGLSANREPLLDYLNRRGLLQGCTVDAVPSLLKYHPALPCRGEDSRGSYDYGPRPAMVAKVLGPDGQPQTFHRTWLDGDILKGRRKKLCTPIQTTRGAAIRLYRPAEILALTEGIETALAVREATGLPVWACLSAGHLKNVVLPDSIRIVAIYADNDYNLTGQSAAYTLAERLIGERRTVEIHIPKTIDSDWLDAFCG